MPAEPVRPPDAGAAAEAACAAGAPDQAGRCPGPARGRVDLDERGAGPVPARLRSPGRRSSSSPATTGSPVPPRRRPTRRRSPRRWWPTSPPAARRPTCSPARSAPPSASSTSASMRTRRTSMRSIRPSAPSRVRRGSGSIDREDAMTVDEASAALALGARLADEAVDAGADVLIAGDMGIGNTTPAATLIGLLTGHAADTVTGRGTGIDDGTLQRKREAVAAAMARGTTALDDPALLLARVGSPDIAAMTGYLRRAAERGRPVILDGIVSCSAALVAERMAPGATRLVDRRPPVHRACVAGRPRRPRPRPAAGPRPPPRRGHRRAAGAAPAERGGRDPRGDGHLRQRGGVRPPDGRNGTRCLTPCAWPSAP